MRRFSLAWLLLAFIAASIMTSSVHASDPPPNVPPPIPVGTATGADSGAEMAVVAMQDETAAYLAAHGSTPYLLFTEDRTRPVQRQDALPALWLKRPATAPDFQGTSQPGEFYAFQIAIYNATDNPATVELATLAIPGIPAAQLHCLNFEARPRDETPLRDGLPLASHTLKTLWMAVECPMSPGVLQGTLTLVLHDTVSARFRTLSVPVQITVAGLPVRDGGVDDSARLARLKWLLPSDLGNAAAPTKGFEPVTRHGNALHILGRTLRLAPTGLPEQVESRFSAGNTQILDHPRNLLQSAVRFVAETEAGVVAFTATGDGLRFTGESPDGVFWEARSRFGDIELLCLGRLEFDGCLTYTLRVTSRRTVDVRDLRLEVPYRADAAPFVMGLGERGGRRTRAIDWKWDVAHYQDRLWLGDVNIGAQWQFYGADYRRPLVNIYYPYRPLVLPTSWCNAGRGGVTVRDASPASQTVTLTAYSGGRRLSVGMPLDFNAEVLLTPFRPIDTDAQWATRFYHPIDTKSVDTDGRALAYLRESGANYLNVHQAEPLNPFINYPFNDASVAGLKQLATDAHAQHDRVGVYYTTRELTKNLPEFFALAQLDGAVILPGPGPQSRTLIHPNGPAAWLNENLRSNFIPAWYQALGGRYAGLEDISVLTTPDGPWNDFYLGGLDWLAEHAAIDGIYIDDTALDRRTLLRARRILEARRPDPLIDLHSWNPYSDADSHYVSASLYMDLMPFLDRLWLGEAANYDQSPDAWLVQYSGIPYGRMSEMLYGGANRWRGMLFGMTGRLGHGDDPRPFWKVWDDFHLMGSEMLGWWTPTCPVKTSAPDILATVYKRKGAVLIALASWAPAERSVTLQIDWRALGIDPTHVVLHAPEISGLQPAATLSSTAPLVIAPHGGRLLILK